MARDGRGGQPSIHNKIYVGKRESKSANRKNIKEKLKTIFFKKRGEKKEESET